MKRILIIYGHPDPDKSRFGYQLASAYKESAAQAGHETKEIVVADLQFPLLRSAEDFNNRTPPEIIGKQQELFYWADHWVLVYPLWLGDMPALLKGFLEQVLRPGFAFSKESSSRFPQKLLKGKSARVVVTMGMPAFIYRWFFHAHSLKNLQHNILNFCGIRPVRVTLLGNIENAVPSRYENCLCKMRRLGGKGI